MSTRIHPFCPGKFTFYVHEKSATHSAWYTRNSNKIPIKKIKSNLLFEHICVFGGYVGWSAGSHVHHTCWDIAVTLCKFCIYQDMRWLCMLTWYLNPSHHFDEHWHNAIFKVILFSLGNNYQFCIPILWLQKSTFYVVVFLCKLAKQFQVHNLYKTSR